MAEASASNPEQCEFESRRPYTVRLLLKDAVALGLFPFQFAVGSMFIVSLVGWGLLKYVEVTIDELLDS